MRRVVISVCCAAFCLLALPAPALAWWDFIEELSGPGPFKGWDLQGRVFCLVQTPALKPDKSEEKDAKGDTVFVTKPRSVPVIGAIVSACKLGPKDVRRAAVDVGVRFLTADGDARFANNHSIDLTTLESSISFNVFSSHPDSDYVDVAFGAGMYWFASEGFESFRGFFMEPVRIEFHPTTAMKRRTKWTALVPVLRVGYLLFPAGFETARFNAAPGVPPRISRDWVLNAAVFFDLEGLF